jgi:UDPglucose 6-dehydrogenase
MIISIIGCGYVGTITGAGLAELGHDVIFADIDEAKVHHLANASAPIYEPGIEDLLGANMHRIRATTDVHAAVGDSDITFICVGTPTGEDGSITLDYIRSAARDTGKALASKASDHLVVVKSTVIPGTTEKTVLPLIEELSRKCNPTGFQVAVNPEFLREGNALHDFFNPDRIILGASDEKSRETLSSLYAPFDCPKIFTSPKTAELIKYASNAFLATKISFANEIGNYCKQLEIDADEVFRGVGLDHRINPAFFRSGCGFGGSCFPKDVRALVHAAEQNGTEMTILKSVLAANEKQPLRIIHLLKKHIPALKGRKIGILGLAFKPETDDIRESRAIPVINRLVAEGADVIAYDPQAMENFRELCQGIAYGSPDEVLNTDAILILTEWDEFRTLDFRGRTVIDGRGIEEAKKNAEVYEGICWTRQ